MSAANYNTEFKKHLWAHLLDNLPTGYADSDVINLDLDGEKDPQGKHLVQSTVTSLRENTAAGGMCFRSYFIHTVQILVNKDSGSEKRQMQQTIQELISAFERKEFDGLYLQEATPDEVGNETGTNYYRIDVNVNGYFEDH